MENANSDPRKAIWLMAYEKNADSENAASKASEAVAEWDKAFVADEMKAHAKVLSAIPSFEKKIADLVAVLDEANARTKRMQTKLKSFCSGHIARLASLETKIALFEKSPEEIDPMHPRSAFRLDVAAQFRKVNERLNGNSAIAASLAEIETRLYSLEKQAERLGGDAKDGHTDYREP